MGFLGKSNEGTIPRKFTDAEVIKMREDWAASGLTMREWVRREPNKKAADFTYLYILGNRNYAYLLPGQKYRIWYDAQLAAVVPQA